MKAKVKATGEVVEVTGVNVKNDKMSVTCKCKDGLETETFLKGCWGDHFESIEKKDFNAGDFYNGCRIEFPVIDWEQRRYEIAKDMLSAIESNSNPQMYQGAYEEQVEWAIRFADELIKKLKNKTK